MCNDESRRNGRKEANGTVNVHFVQNVQAGLNVVKRVDIAL